MRALNIRTFLGLGLALAAISLGATGVHGQDTLPPTAISEADLLAYLPVGAKLADIPFVQFGTTEEVKKTRPNVFYSDVDADGQEEIVVAYYTTPHEYIISGQAQEG
ncbi:MAG: hypothetical protein ACYTBJ_12675, partial [Planctomycetota bacterium]